MRVVPVSMAARPSLLETEIDLPWTVIAKRNKGIRGRIGKIGNAHIGPAEANRKA